MTQEEIDKKAEELSVKYGKPVSPLIVTIAEAETDDQGNQTKPAELAIAYIKEPTLAAQMDAYDKMIFQQSLTLPGQSLFEACAIKEESDERFFSVKSEYAPIKIGAYKELTKSVKAFGAVLKKK